jgi:hypothetical protein
MYLGAMDPGRRRPVPASLLHHATASCGGLRPPGAIDAGSARISWTDRRATASPPGRTGVGIGLPMPQIFSRRANTLARVSVPALLVLGAACLAVVAIVQRSPYSTGVGVAVAQPVPFSHQHHVGQDGIDCRYCHTSVEQSRFAGIPSTEICMNCHRQIWNESPMLAPVRDSYRRDVPLVWNRVNDLPDFVYFDHSIHVAKGIGCESCHGRVDRMPLTWRARTLDMAFCLECHRDPERHVRPREAVFEMGWRPPADQPSLGRELVRRYGITSKTSCSTCHR